MAGKRGNSQASWKSQMRANYLKEFPRCQYTMAVGHVVLFRNSGMFDPASLCVEHIWNRKGDLSEHVSNYASVMPVPHEWKHANSVLARIAITEFKVQLDEIEGGNRHFDIDALREIAGFDVPGWVENKMQSYAMPRWCFNMGEKVIRAARRRRRRPPPLPNPPPTPLSSATEPLLSRLGRAQTDIDNSSPQPG